MIQNFHNNFIGLTFKDSCDMFTIVNLLLYHLTYIIKFFLMLIRLICLFYKSLCSFFINMISFLYFKCLPTERIPHERRVRSHRQVLEQRKIEIEEYKRQNKVFHDINTDIQIGALANKVDRSLSIRGYVLPEEEKKEEEELPELTEEHLIIVKKAFSGNPNEVLARKFNLNITRRDIVTLQNLNWLNDEVINFYMNLIAERGKNHPRYPKAYTMNTFFYPKLVKDGPEALRRWTRRVDIFSYDLICIPIHLGVHWCMAIIDFRERSIKYYDSMGSSNPECTKRLKRYLEYEHMDKKKEKLDTSEYVLEDVKDIPQQMNGSDCGMFSCMFAEYLSRNANISFTQEHMPYFRKKMVVEIIRGELLLN